MAMAEPEGNGKGKATLAQIMAQESAATVIDSIKLMVRTSVDGSEVDCHSQLNRTRRP
jgi:hypothetical protein